MPKSFFYHLRAINPYQTYKDSFSGLSKNVWILALILLINRTGAMVILFMPLYVTKDLSFSLTLSGYIMGAFGLGSILGSYTGGYFTDKYSFYDVQTISLFSSGLVLFLLQIVESFLGIALIVFVYSLLADSFRPANAVAISHFAKPENKTRSFSLMRLAINLGFALGPAIGGIMAVAIGFKSLFLLNALTCFVAGFSFLLLLPRKSVRQKPVLVEKKDRSISAYKDGYFIKFITLVCLYAFVFFQLFATIPVFLRDTYGYTEDIIGYFAALNGLIIVVFEMPIVHKLEKAPSYFKFIFWGCMLAAVGFVFLVTGYSFLWLVALYIVFISFSEILAMPFMLNMAVNRPGRDRQGQYMALYSISYGVAHILAPVIGMKTADNLGFNSLYVGCLVLIVLIGIGFLQMNPTSKKSLLKETGF
jgi:predicted MFS family arabinose efflux permease